MLLCPLGADLKNAAFDKCHEVELPKCLVSFE
jgi:hypothetical protein